MIQKSVFIRMYSFYMSKVIFFQNGVSGHFEYMPLEKKTSARDIDAKKNSKRFKEVKSIVKAKFYY